MRNEEKIIVIDFGSQYNHLITRRIRNLGVYSELVSNNIEAENIKNDKSIIGIIFSGGPNSVYEKNSPKIDKNIFTLNIPILGICYGAQLICHLFGGKIIQCQKKEYGTTKINIDKFNLLTNSLKKQEIVWMSHGDQVKILPKGFIQNAHSLTCKYAIFSNCFKKIYAVQFHPEAIHTKNGTTILKNFVFKICHAKKKWKAFSYINDEIKRIRQLVKNEEVLCALSGGIDSAVTASVISKAIGKKLTCLFVDHGLMRKNEPEIINNFFKNNLNINFLCIDAKKKFLNTLAGIIDPEKKRKIIGKLFIQCFDEYVKRHPKIKWLAQGTLYPDIIESGNKMAATIKSHHNVGGLPKNLKLKLLEPLKNLYKDEVKILAKKLNLPNQIINRQPFPGPGLAVRIIGEITPASIKLIQDADAIVREEIIKAKLEKKIWQYFAVLPNIKTVGTKGDQRSYENVVVIRAVQSKDGMSADYSQIPYQILTKISTRITNEVKGVNRVVYDITSKPPGTIEWE